MAPEVLADYKKFMTRALQLCRAGKYRAALDEYTQAIKCRPDCAKAYSCRAYCYRELEMFENAIFDYNNSIELDVPASDDHVQALVDRAECAFTLQRYQSARADLELAAQLQPDNCDIIYALGKVHHQLHEYDKAASDFQRVLDAEPNAGDAQEAFDLAVQFSLATTTAKSIRHHEMRFDALFESVVALQNPESLELVGPATGRLARTILSSRQKKRASLALTASQGSTSQHIDA